MTKKISKIKTQINKNALQYLDSKLTLINMYIKAPPKRKTKKKKERTRKTKKKGRQFHINIKMQTVRLLSPYTIINLCHVPCLIVSCMWHET